MYDVKPGQLVEVDWIDPSASSNWTTAKEVTRLPKMICRSVGWVHLVDDDGIVVTACYCDCGGRELLLHQNLPWGCIEQIWILT